jgi:hypothetical protein
MANNEVFVHTKAGRSRRQIDATTKVGDLREGDSEASVWLEDATEALDPEAMLASVVKERDQVDVSRCRRVAVTVRYGGDSKTKEFTPGTTIARVFVWATGKEGFSLSSSEAAKHVLGLCGTQTQPDRADHVGTYATDECTLCLDLAPKERFEG